LQAGESLEHKSQAIILKVMDYSEADRLITFFTEDFGKQKGVAKNAKKSKKRFGGGLEPGTIGVSRFVEKHGVELVRLEDFSIDLAAWNLSSSLSKICALHISLEIADKLLPLGHASFERYQLLYRWVKFLSENEPHDFHRHAFYYKWLSASGIAPVFDKCILCGKIKSHFWHISPSHGGVICGGCRHYASDIRITNDTLS
jgi:DNA repair protein RecO (recombination protein O)